MAIVDHGQEPEAERGFILPDSGLEHDRSAGDEEKVDNSPIPNRIDQGEGRPPRHYDSVAIVDWEGDNDPEKPLNWSTRQKAPNIVIMFFMTFLTTLASSMFAPGVAEVMEDFHSNNTILGSFVVSVYVLGSSLGPPVAAPLSEFYGRLPIYLVCNILFVVSIVACALVKSMGMLISFRIIAGISASAPMTIGAGTIADLIPAEKRGVFMALWALGPLLGPIIGPIIGGFLTQAEGWRWTFWLIAICSGLMTILSFFFMRETYPPVLLESKAAKLCKETGNPNIQSALNSGLTAKELFFSAITRPLKFLFLSPIVFILSLYSAVSYGVLYLLFTTFPGTFQLIYGFSTGTVGLSYLGLGLGFSLGLFIFGGLSDVLVKRLSVGGPPKPEYRMPLLVIGAIFFPIGLFWYGWAAEFHVHWTVPIIGTTWVGVALILSFMAIGTYLVDAFTIYAASATAANAILRSLGGAFLPLAGRPMFEKLGLGWGCSALGFISLLFCPGALLIYRYGERIQTNPRFQPNFLRTDPTFLGSIKALPS